MIFVLTFNSEASRSPRQPPKSPPSMSQDCVDKRIDHLSTKLQECLDIMVDTASSVSNVERAIERLSTKVCLGEETTSALRGFLKCKICMSMPADDAALSTCCGQLVGCMKCIEDWKKEPSNNMCLLCRQVDFSTVVVRGLSGIQNLLK